MSVKRFFGSDLFMVFALIVLFVLGVTSMAIGLDMKMKEYPLVTAVDLRTVWGENTATEVVTVILPSWYEFQGAIYKDGTNYIDPYFGDSHPEINEYGNESGVVSNADCFSINTFEQANFSFVRSDLEDPYCLPFLVWGDDIYIKKSLCSAYTSYG